MKKKIGLLLLLLLLLSSVIFAGCNSAKVQENEAQIKPGVQTEAIGETANNEETTNSSKNDVIEIGDDNFVRQMDEIHAYVGEYEGKTVSYEGFVVQVDEEGKEYTVARDYDLSHEDHSHAIYVGLYSIYKGEWPAEDSWVRVTGKIRKEIVNGQEYPLLEIEELKVMDVRGQEKVTS